LFNGLDVVLDIRTLEAAIGIEKCTWLGLQVIRIWSLSITYTLDALALVASVWASSPLGWRLFIHFAVLKVGIR